MNKYLKLHKIVTSTWFDIFMLGIIILNMIIILWSYLTTHEDILNALETADNVFVYIFVAEFIIKIIGLGVKNYFKDNWNKFDFALVVSSLVMNVTVNLLKSARSLRSAKSLRFFRVARSQRALRLLKFIRKINFFRVLLNSAATFQRIKDILNKSLMCITSFKRIMAVMFMTFYIYAILGSEILHYSESEFSARFDIDSEYATFSAGIIGNFTTFGEAWLAYFQILTQSSWHYIIYH